MANKKLKVGNVPHLRFPGFTGEWEVKKLGEIAAFSNGKGHEKDIDENGIYILVNSKFVSTDGNVIKRTNKQLIPLFCNQIVMVMSDLPNGKALAKCFYIDNNNLYTLNQRICSLTINEDDSKFIYYSINRNEFYLKFDDGVNQTNLKKAEVLDCPVYLPSLSEQQKIASFLSLIDERIQTQIKIIEELKLLKNTLSKKIFSRQLRFKDDNRNDYPEWQYKKLGELATITTGSSNREDSVLDGEYTFFDRSQDVRTSKRYLFNKEAVIVPGEGQKFIPKYFIGKFDLHQRTYAIFDFIGLSGKYLYYHMVIDENHLQSQSVGSTVKSLRLPMFQSMPIKLPSLAEQIKIADFLSYSDSKTDVETELLKKLEEQKIYLLQNLFI